MNNFLKDGLKILTSYKPGIQTYFVTIYTILIWKRERAHSEMMSYIIDIRPKKNLWLLELIDIIFCIIYMIRCNSCNVAFTSKKGLHQHMKGKRHTDRINGTSPILDYSCACGKTYSHRQSLHVHKTSCTLQSSQSVKEIIEDLTGRA